MNTHLLKVEDQSLHSIEEMAPTGVAELVSPRTNEGTCESHQPTHTPSPGTLLSTKCQP